ncbi:MAG: hypothetical protein ACTHJM_07725 [Marmoricola sp.]
MNRRWLLVPLSALAFLALAACGGSGSGGSHGTALVGLFKLTPGVCTQGTPTGSYFRMIQPNGTIAHGKFFLNPDSKCPDQSFSVEKPGKDGGLVTGSYQPSTGRAFDAHGNALADRITVPGSFTAIKFGISTNAVDPQTGRKVTAPQIYNDNGKLSGQISAWSAAWNNLYFNQGSPKPDGTRPGLTTPVSGTYDPTTHAFVLTWASQIVGGPFNGFTGYWHLQGTFVR